MQSANLNVLPGGTYYAGEFAVAVPAVPEPGEWALMIAGLAAIGAKMRLARHRLALPGA